MQLPKSDYSQWVKASNCGRTDKSITFQGRWDWLEAIKFQYEWRHYWERRFWVIFKAILRKIRSSFTKNDTLHRSNSHCCALCQWANYQSSFSINHKSCNFSELFYNIGHITDISIELNTSKFINVARRRQICLKIKSKLRIKDERIVFEIKIKWRDERHGA